MKRKTLLIIAIIVLAVAALFLIFDDYFIPRPIIQEDVKDAQFFDVLYLNDEVSANAYQVVDILKNYNSVKSFKDYSPYPQDDVIIEINMVVNQKPLHVVLGDFNIWYESADMGSYEIIDGERLLSEMMDLLS